MASGRRSLLVGWLYADLLLVLLIASLSGMVMLSVTDPPSPATSPAPSPSAPRDPDPGLDTEPIELSIDVDSSALVQGSETVRKAVRKGFRRDFRDAVRSALQDRGLDPEQARIGFVITFGYNTNMARARDVSREANRQARLAEPDMMNPASVKSYGNISAYEDPDQVTFELFLLR